MTTWLTFIKFDGKVMGHGSIRQILVVIQITFRQSITPGGILLWLSGQMRTESYPATLGAFYPLFVQQQSKGTVGGGMRSTECPSSLANVILLCCCMQVVSFGLVKLLISHYWQLDGIQKDVCDVIYVHLSKQSTLVLMIPCCIVQYNFTIVLVLFCCDSVQ